MHVCVCALLTCIDSWATVIIHVTMSDINKTWMLRDVFLLLRSLLSPEVRCHLLCQNVMMDFLQCGTSTSSSSASTLKDMCFCGMMRDITRNKHARYNTGSAARQVINFSDAARQEVDLFVCVTVSLR